MKRSNIFLISLLVLILSVVDCFSGTPFMVTEDFSDTHLKDEVRTNANWSTEEQEVYLAWQKATCGAMSNPDPWDIGEETDHTWAVAVGDVDGDDDLDVVTGNYYQAIKLYLNNGSIYPFFNVSSTNIGNVFRQTFALALADLDNDGDLDLISGERNLPNKLFLNNGTTNPFEGVIEYEIGGETDDTRGIAIGDLDGDGDLDMVAGNIEQTNKMYLNNGTNTPFNTESTGFPIGSETDSTREIVLGDLNGDGNLDVVVGNDNYPGQLNRLYLNSGDDPPFSETTIGLPIGANDIFVTNSIALGDMNGDGQLDVVTGNNTYPEVHPNRLYLNNGTDDPFSDVLTGLDIGTDDNDYTWGIAVGDIDGDGDLDVVAGNYSQLNKLYLNNGTDNPFGDISTGIPIRADTDDTRVVALYDMNGDGVLDLLAGNQTHKNRLYLNNASENPFNGVAGNSITDIAANTLAPAIGDIDGDGDLDVVTANTGTNLFFLNNGSTDPFGDVVAGSIGNDSDSTRDIVLGDMDNDGDLDVVAANTSTNRLYLNNGTANPFDGTTTGLSIGNLDADYTSFVLVGDVDNDGDLDVVTGNGSFSNDQANRLYLNNGTTNPFSDVDTGTPIGANEVGRATAIALGDVDSDGDLDFFASDSGTDPKIYFNNGSSDPFEGIDNGTVIGDMSNTHALALGDIDGDGDQDLVVGNYNVDNRFCLNNGTSDPFSEVTTGSQLGFEEENTKKIVLADIDRDGDLDAITQNYNEPNRIYLNNGTSTPFSGEDVGYIIGESEPYDYSSIALGDIDNDGYYDMVTGNYSRPVQLYLNGMPKRSIGKAYGTLLGSNTNFTKAIAIGDVDGDGDLDIVAAKQNRTNKLYLNVGSTNPFVNIGEGLDIGTDTDDTFDIALGDVDGDGDLDVVTGNNGSTNKLYLNNGADPIFSDLGSGSNIGSDTDTTKGVALGDVNGDGNLDVVAGNSHQINKLYLNDGDEDPFDTASAINIGVNTGDTTAIALGDIDRDGDLDVISGDYRQTNKLYLNNRVTPPFSDLSSWIDITGDSERTYSVVLGDINNDGNLDVVIGNTDSEEGHYNRLYLNDGIGNPFDTASGIPIGSDLDYTQSIALGDIDNDGDLDIVAGNEYATGTTNKLYLNNGDVADPFGDITNGIIIDTVADQTMGIALADIDGNGGMDIITANRDRNNMLYRLIAFNTANGEVSSIEVDMESIDNISNATLTSVVDAPNHTRITYYLSNNGGVRFFQVYPGQEFLFYTLGNDLRWRAELLSLSPVITPRIQEITITNRNIAPQITAGGILSYTEDDPPTVIDDTILVADIDDVNLSQATVSVSNGYIDSEDALGFTNQNGISGTWNAGTGILNLTGSSTLQNYQTALRSVTYVNTNHGNPAIGERTITFMINDGVSGSFSATCIVLVNRTNDPPEIANHNPDPVNIVQNDTVALSINTPPAPAGHIYLTADDPDNISDDLSLIIQSGPGYLVQENLVTPLENYFGQLTVPLILYDGIDYGEAYDLTIQVNDITDPTVNLAAVQVGGLSVDVSFSEPMGTGVVTPVNYIISGEGRGTLSDHPDSVSYLYENIYRLTWNSGEMQDGGDIIITAANVQDASGRTIGSPDTGIDTGGGIGFPPETNVNNPGDEYTSVVNIALTCSDTGSGCASTYYAMDGGDFVLYSGPIDITADTIFEFYSVDDAGNQESVQTEVYTIEIPTTISCDLPDLDPDEITFGERFIITGKIDPPPNNSNQGVLITLTPPGTLPPPLNETIYRSASANNVTGDFQFEADCDLLTGAGNWQIQTSWVGDESHGGANSDAIILEVNQANSKLSLDVVMAEAVKINSRPPIGGNFTPNPYCSTMNLTDTPITLYATEPNSGPTHVLAAYTNQYGQYLIDYDHAEGGGEFAFDVLGDWTIYAEYVETTNIAGDSTDPPVIIRVIPTAGYAIVVQGRVSSGEGMPSHHKTATFVYDKLKDRQLLDDDIQYLSWLYHDGWDGDPSRTNIQAAITEWARDKMDPNYHPSTGPDEDGQPGDLYIIMVDHGWTAAGDDEEGIFYIHPDAPITSTELSGWLDDLQGSLTGEAANRNIVVILGFCRAGAFMDQLVGPNRVVIASADKHESSHRGPQDVDAEGQPLRDGEYFVSEFFKSVSYGKSIKHSFEEATILTEAFTSTGSGVTNAPYYDDSVQHPLLNDNGDALGSNELSIDPGEDGAVSDLLFIGASPPQGNDPGDVLIMRVAAGPVPGSGTCGRHRGSVG